MLQIFLLFCFLLEADDSVHYVADTFDNAERAVRILKAREFMGRILDPTGDVGDLSIEQQYQVTALRELFDSLGVRMARWEGRSVFDKNRNALRCGRLVEVTDYREDMGPDGLPCVECRCRFEIGGVSVRLGFSVADSLKDAEILSVHIVSDPEEPIPEFFPTHGYYRHKNHFYSTLFSTEVTGPPHPNEPASVVIGPENRGETRRETEMPPERLNVDTGSPRQRRLAETFLYDVRTAQDGAPEVDQTDGLTGSWQIDVNHLASLFRKFSHEMARRGGRNLIDGDGNALRCGRFTHVAEFRNYTHFDGTLMIEAVCRMEWAGILVRLAFDETENRVTAIHVVRDPTQPVPEFYPKTGYFENLDPAPLSGRNCHITATTGIENNPETRVAAFAILLRKIGSTPKSRHAWQSEQNREPWEDPVTKIRWEPFEPSVSTDTRRKPWRNGFPYNEAVGFNASGRFHWGRLPTGEYRIAASTVPSALTYGDGESREIDFAVFLGDPVVISDSRQGVTTEIVFRNIEAKTLRIRDRETGEAVSGVFSLKIHPRGFPGQIRFHAYRTSDTGDFLLRNLLPGPYTLEIRRLQGTIVEPVRQSYRFEFDGTKDWTVELPHPWEGTEVSR